jgi:ribosomal protein S18 acetylase RimI-like enzyme
VSDVRIEQLPVEDLDRIREIDRSETVGALHVRDGDELRPIETRLEIPPWGDAELERIKARVAPKLAAGGVLLGAFAGDQLVGAAVLSGRFVSQPQDHLELAFLYIDNSHRGRGIGKTLLEEVSRSARDRGASGLYISASDTDSAVRFYLKEGCRLAHQIDPKIAAENEPTDIHLTRDLS